METTGYLKKIFDKMCLLNFDRTANQKHMREKTCGYNIGDKLNLRLTAKIKIQDTVTKPICSTVGSTTTTIATTTKKMKK